MTETNFPGGITSQGMSLPAGGVPATYGTYFYVDSDNGSDGNNGLSMDEAFATLAQAQLAVTTNKNDVILLSGVSAHNMDTMLITSKSRVHYIGLDGGGRLTAQGAKIQLNATGNAAAVVATILNTGTRNSFINLKIINSGTDAASIAGMIDEGEGTHIENCSIMKLTDLNVATVADFICRADSPTYVNVEFGFDTLVQSAARATFWIKNDGATRAKHIRSYGCHFTCASSAATKSFILIANTSSLAFGNVFVKASFNNALVSSISAAALNDAVTSVSGLAEGNILFVDPASDTTEFCTAVTDKIKVVGPLVAITAGEAVTPA